MDRREVIKAGAALAAVAVVGAPVVAAAAPCPTCNTGSEYHECCIHDESGKRWDAYTFEDATGMMYDTIDVQTTDTEWTCYCGRHEDTDAVMPVGTRCVWRKTSYEYDEWECECEEEYMDSWLHVQTTDWRAMAEETL